MKSFFGVTFKRRSLFVVFFANVGEIFWGQTTLSATFARIFLGFVGNLPGFSGILPRFSRILPKFSKILPWFSTNQNFWECACTPASYTAVSSYLYMESVFIAWAAIQKQKVNENWAWKHIAVKYIFCHWQRWYFNKYGAVSHIRILDCWCEEKNINPTSPGYEEKVVTLFNRSGAWAGWVLQITPNTSTLNP